MRKLMFEDDDELDIDTSYHIADSSADMSMTQV